MKYKIDFSIGCAIENGITPKGKATKKVFALFIDQQGLYISKRNGIEYMTENNCEII